MDDISVAGREEEGLVGPAPPDPSSEGSVSLPTTELFVPAPVVEVRQSFDPALRLTDAVSLAETPGVPIDRASNLAIYNYLLGKDPSKPGMVIEVPHTRRTASTARYMLEVWLLPPTQERTIVRSIVSILWVNGETMGPGGDQMIFECPYPECKGLFYPGFHVFRSDERPPMGLPAGFTPQVPYVICESCHRPVSKEGLVDRRGVAGTWDVLGRHLSLRFHQLQGDADILKRIMHENMHVPVPDVVSSQRGAVDRYLRAQGHRDHVYWFVDQIMAETAKGIDMDRLFTNFMKA